jgi:alanine dehydrogenase
MDYMKEGSILVSMLHYPTRLARVEYLKERNIFGVSMDLIRNDLMERIVVNYKGTSGNGVKAAFKELERLLRHSDEVQKGPISVSVMGMGMVGLMASKFAGKFGGKRNEQLFNSLGINSVITNMLSRNITSDRKLMSEILSNTDILIDATTRDDASKYIIRNEFLGSLKKHSIILDLTADPYLEDIEPIQVKAIEGIPAGTLDRYVLHPDDKAYASIPKGVMTNNRRTVISCNAWPGVNPERCMKLYGIQMAPIIKRLISQSRTQLDEINDDFFMRAIYRSTIEYFEKTL